MSKYIIEIEDEPFVRRSALYGEKSMYRAKGFNSLVFDQFGLDKLTPLDKELSSELGEAYHKGFKAGQHEATTLEYQQGLDDAWETIIKLAHTTYAQRSEIFDGLQDILSIMQKFSPSEVTAKIREYEAKQESDEIRVGDEVKHKDGNVRWTSVVVEIDGDTIYLMGDTGAVADYQRCNFKKTGRHFPQVAELLEAMKGGAE